MNNTAPFVSPMVIPSCCSFKAAVENRQDDDEVTEYWFLGEETVDVHERFENLWT
jgi:hypothetical protein